MSRFHSVAIDHPWPLLRRRRDPAPARRAAPEDRGERALALRRREAFAEAQRQRSHAEFIKQGRLF